MIAHTTTQRPTLRFELAAACGGRLIVLLTDRGLVDLAVGDDDFDLISQMRRRYPRAALVPDRGVHLGWVESVIRRIEGDSASRWSSETPVDLHTSSQAGMPA